MHVIVMVDEELKEQEPMTAYAYLITLLHHFPPQVFKSYSISAFMILILFYCSLMTLQRKENRERQEGEEGKRILWIHGCGSCCSLLFFELRE